MQIGDRIICKTCVSCNVIFPSLPSGASGDVLAICGEKPELWNYDLWLRRSQKFHYGGIVFSSGLTKWGNIAGPLSKQERATIMQHSKLSRPGRSYWKTAFLVLFLEWAQEAYWDLIDTQRAFGLSRQPLRRLYKCIWTNHLVGLDRLPC